VDKVLTRAEIPDVLGKLLGFLHQPLRPEPSYA
jgi:hypothetical protein